MAQKISFAAHLLGRIEEAQKSLDEGILDMLKRKKAEAKGWKEGKDTEEDDEKLATRKNTYLGKRKVKNMPDDDDGDKK